MNRRSFLALASGLLVATPEPVRRYFFAPAGGWAELASDPAWIERVRGQVICPSVMTLDGVPVRAGETLTLVANERDASKNGLYVIGVSGTAFRFPGGVKSRAHFRGDGKNWKLLWAEEEEQIT